MAATGSNIPKNAPGFLLGLDSKTLLALVAGLFVADLMVPDALPFIDEVVLGTMTILLARWQMRRPRVEPEPAKKPGEKNVTPS